MLDIAQGPDAAARPRAVGATWLSIGLHVAVAGLIAVIVREKPVSNRGIPVERNAPPLVVWLDRTGRIVGSGGQGDLTREPAPRTERPGPARLTVPARVPPSPVPRAVQEPPLQQITIPAVPEASGLREVPGVLSDMSLVNVSARGPGAGRGAGDGDGPGLDRGFGGNWGGGSTGPGGNASSPELIKQVRPNYTSSALQAQVRGTVVMEAVILPNGSVGEVKIVRSLDRTFGLDNEAIKAVKQWRFRPGTRAGDPVAMLVSVEMLFELR